jgi:hypothetical protein
MKKKHGVFIGFVVLLTTALFALGGCGNTEIPSVYHGTYAGMITFNGITYFFDGKSDDTMFTVDATSIKCNAFTIPGLRTSGGGTLDADTGIKFLYVFKDTEKIGIAYTKQNGSSRSIDLGKSFVEKYGQGKVNTTDMTDTYKGSIFR